jgi:pyruvate/2-oxoglutarate dehydrogenase complex dihydrolipoamide acyltransferase (E2) component
MISDLRYERRREEEQQRRAKRRKGKTTELQRRRPDAAAAADVEAKRARAAARNLVDELGVDVVWRVLEVSHDYAILRELRKEIEEFDAAEAR